MSELLEMTISKGINKRTNEPVAQISYRDSTWGWLNPRSMSKPEWTLIGKEMGWNNKGGHKHD